MSDDDQQKPKAILARCPELEATTGHVRSFAAMMAIRSARRLPQWIADACADERHGLRGFADGLLTDFDAVVRGKAQSGVHRGVRHREGAAAGTCRGHCALLPPGAADDTWRGECAATRALPTAEASAHGCRFLRHAARQLGELGEEFDTALDGGLLDVFDNADRTAYVDGPCSHIGDDTTQSLSWSISPSVAAIGASGVSGRRRAHPLVPHF
jgi:hypothetical protein